MPYLCVMFSAKINWDLRKYLVTGVLGILFSWYFICTNMFFHTHTIDEGIISHSHPYSGSPEKPGHSHTYTEFLTIASLSQFIAVVVVMVCLGLILPRTAYRIVSEHRTGAVTEEARFPESMRGPPSSVQFRLSL